MDSNKYVPPERREDEKSIVEMQRIKEGKCKRCGENWDPKHRCAKRKEPTNLYNCEATNYSNSEDYDIEETEDATEFSPELDDGSIPRVSLSTMTSISQPQTLKLKGHIKKNNVVVLIDSGSTHNSLDATVAKKLNIFSFPLPNMKVMVANSKKIEKVGKCHKVNLQIQDFNLESSFFMVPLGGVDVVLGIQWLRTLGTYAANHQVQFIKLKWGGQKYKLHGFQASGNKVVSSSQMMKPSRKGAPAYVVQCH